MCQIKYFAIMFEMGLRTGMRKLETDKTTHQVKANNVFWEILSKVMWDMCMCVKYFWCDYMNFYHLVINKNGLSVVAL